MSTSTANRVWVKFISLFPEERPHINVFASQSDLLPEYTAPGRWMLKQNENGEIFMTNLSELFLQIEDTFLEKNESMRISGREMISFDQIEPQDENFQYCLHLNVQKNPLKRDREEVVKSKEKPSQKEVKLCEEVIGACGICSEIDEKCVLVKPCLHKFCTHCLLSSLKTSTLCPTCQKPCRFLSVDQHLQTNLTLMKTNFPEKFKAKKTCLQKELMGEVVKTSQGLYIGGRLSGQIFGRGIMLLGNGAIFEGLWKNGKKEGEGRLMFPSGWIFKGKWKDDEIEPSLEISMHDKVVYKGEVAKNYLKHGKGEYFYENGDFYDGQFKDDMRSGFGKLKCKSGEMYSGDWLNNMKNGQGSRKYVDGNLYKGEWKDDKREGYGILKQANGDVYEGEWKDDKREGSGVLRNQDKSFFKGIWKDDKREGLGTLKLANGDVYQGNWEDDVRDGHGVMEFALGGVYDGEWKNDKQHGQGTMTWKGESQRSFKGTWENGKMKQGTLTEDGEVYDLVKR